MSFNSTWHTANPDAVGGTDNNDPPDPGIYDVTLIDAGAFTSKKGDDWVKLEWRRLTDGYDWTVLLGFASEKAANFAKRECRELGVDVDSVASLDELDSALKQQGGHYFEVEVVQNGDFRNTYLRGKSGEHVSDIPTSTADFAPAMANGPVSGDADIPF